MVCEDVIPIVVFGVVVRHCVVVGPVQTSALSACTSAYFSEFRGLPDINESPTVTRLSSLRVRLADSLLTMTSIGTGYDLSASTYSPDGRIFQVNTIFYFVSGYTYICIFFQVEYANKAVENSGSAHFPYDFDVYSDALVRFNSTAIGIRCKDGIVLAVEKLVHSKLLVPGANRRIQTIDRHIGLVDLVHYIIICFFINLEFNLYRQLQVSLQMADIYPTELAMKLLTTEIPTDLPPPSR